jgi:acetyl esterase/lipase
MNAYSLLIAFCLAWPVWLATAADTSPSSPPVAEATRAAFTRVEDVVYGRKFGTALTLDVFKPATPNGAGLLFMVSGGFFSSHEAINAGYFKEFLNRGYTVFAVVHGSQPRFIIPEIVEDIHRAVRFARYHAKEYGVDPQRLGILGGSAGGHLSLTIATQGKPGAPEAKDPVDRVSSSVQAVACLFPPTDLLNYGAPGVDGVGVGILAYFKPAFGPRSDTAESRQVYGKEISPIYFIHTNLPPILIIHGDADKLVPVQQARLFIEAARKANAAEMKLVERPGKDHGWPDMQPDIQLMADWFDAHLKPVAKAP